METWPNLFIVGAPKAGTSSLYAYLKEIPGIYMSKIKEPNYFSGKTIPDDNPLHPIREKKKYLCLFKGVSDEKILGEASPSYLTDPDAPKLIHQLVPNAHIIIILRDPVERVFSDYLMFLRLDVLKSSFHNEVKKALGKNNIFDEQGVRLQHSMYFENVKRYIEIFGQSQVKILIFEDFISDTKRTVEEVLKFLGIDYSLENFSGEAYNQFVVPRGQVSQFIYKNRKVRKIAEKLFSTSQRKFLKEKFLVSKQPKPKIESEDRKILIDYYKDDVKKLQNFLNRKLPWENFIGKN